MDKFFERLGLYEFWGIIIPGIITNAMGISILKYVFNSDIINFSNAATLMDGVIFIVMSYFTGFILHECTSRIQEKLFFSKLRPSRDALLSGNEIFSQADKDTYWDVIKKIMGNKYSNINDINIVTQDEIDQLRMINKKFSNKKDAKLIKEIKRKRSYSAYTYSKNFIEKNRKSAKHEQLHTTFLMSRELCGACIFFIFVLIISLIFKDYFQKAFVLTFNATNIYLSLGIFVFLFFPLYFRTKRFAMLHVRQVFSQFIVEYNDLEKIEKVEKINNLTETNKNDEQNV